MSQDRAAGDARASRIPSTVEELQRALAAIGRNPDAVQWDDDSTRVAQDGVWVVRTDGRGGVTITMVSRDTEIGTEHFDSEASAVAVLHRRMVTNRPTGRTESDEERAEAIRRMQAKAAAESEGRRARAALPVEGAADTIDAVIAALTAAGHPRQVQWADRQTGWDEGSIICRRDGAAVIVTQLGRHESGDVVERFASEPDAAIHLRRRLVDRPVRRLSPGEREVIRERMTKRSEETKARLAAEQTSPGALGATSWAVPGSSVLVGSDEHDGWEEAEYRVVGLYPGDHSPEEFLQARQDGIGRSLYLGRRFGPVSWATERGTGKVPVSAWYGDASDDGVPFAGGRPIPEAWLYVRPSPTTLLDRLADELTARGPVERLDFHITGRRPDELPSSELVAMRVVDGGYRVWYRDMGVSRTLLETSDFAAAREVFVRETLVLARSRGRRLRE